mmetsp:Transcript_54094/g.143125  ORF Transcript_54094/g.143125 Transcript_54094/m.143125 type:complete len:351 (-) Transcript_54094:708-1760(-)
MNAKWVVALVLGLHGVDAFSPLHNFGARLGLRGSHEATSRTRANLCTSLKAQMDKTSAVGWMGRPGSVVSEVEHVGKSKDARMSSSGTLQLDGANIRYDYLPGDSPAIVFLPALNQTRHGAKSTALKTWCRRQGRSFLVADYYGMGQSSGEYKDGCVSRWSKDTAGLIDWLHKEHAHSGVVLVGAGVGGWVMLHAARMRPDLVKGLVGVAADPDFTEAVVLPALSSDVKAKIEREGIAEIEWGGKPYTLSKKLIEDGRKMILLNGGPASIEVDCPVRLIQGLGDEEIPPERSLQLSECLKSRNVVVTYVKAGGHTLEDDEDDFRRIYSAIEELEHQNARKNWMRSMINAV